MSTTYMLRTCKADMTAYGGFRWPESGPVECPDWRADNECGHGLHGLLMGEGNGSLVDWSPDAKWLVVEIDPATMINLDGKVKVPRGVVVFCGHQHGATEWLAQHGGLGHKITGGTATAGEYGTATAGDRGTATAGEYGTATAGDRGTATAGYGGTATAGDRGTATAGDRGTATAGDRGTATAGYGGTATAGYGGTATAGYGGTATAGDRGTATAGDRGTATAGEYGSIVIRYWDSSAERYLLSVANVGENGIEAGKKYKLDSAGKFVLVTGS